jgi:hypothetical protein
MSTAGGLVSLITGKSSGSLSAQAAISNVDTKQSAVVVPANAARRIRILRFMMRLHVFLRRSFTRELQRKVPTGRYAAGEIRQRGKRILINCQKIGGRGPPIEGGAKSYFGVDARGDKARGKATPC